MLQLVQNFSETKDIKMGRDSKYSTTPSVNVLFLFIMRKRHLDDIKAKGVVDEQEKIVVKRKD